MFNALHYDRFLFAAPFSDLPPTSPVSPKDASIDVAPPPIKRPSDLLSQISSYINLLQTQVHAIFPELGVDEVIEGALHQQLDPISARMLLADAEMSAMRPLLGAAKNKSTKALLSTYSLAPATTQSTSQSLLAAYTKW